MRRPWLALALLTTSCHLVVAHAPPHASPLDGASPREGAADTLADRGARDGGPDRGAGEALVPPPPDGGPPPNSCGGLFATEGWCWENPLPMGAPLRGLWSDGTNHYAVGGYGLVVRFAPSKPPEQIAVPTSVALNAIWGSGAKDIYVVGDQGMILHYDGATWLPTPFGADHLRGVWGSGPTDIHAVGDNGTTLHFDGKNWFKNPSTQTFGLWAVHGSSPTRAFAVGVNETILAYNGTTWNKVHGGAGAQLFAVHDDGGTVVAGGNGKLLTSVDGSSWTPLATPTGMSSIRGLGRRAGALVAAGGEQIALWDGKAWTQEAPAGLPSLYALAPSGDLAAGASGLVLERQNSVWQRLGSGLQSTVHALAGSGPDDLHAVGNQLLLRWDGKTWVEQLLPLKSAFNAVGVRSKAEAFAVGDSGNALRWNGSGWTALGAKPPAPHQTATLTSIWVPPAPAKGFFATGANALLHHDGASWAPTPVATLKTPGASLRGLFGAGGKLFAVGTKGVVLVFDEASGVPEETVLTSQDLFAVWGSSASDLHAVGYNVIFHYDGASWSPAKNAPQAILFAVTGVSPTEVVAAGLSGAILRFDGVSWSALPSPTGAELRAVHADTGAVRVAGFGGIILRRP